MPFFQGATIFGNDHESLFCFRCLGGFHRFPCGYDGRRAGKLSEIEINLKSSAKPLSSIGNWRVLSLTSCVFDYYSSF